VSNIFLPMLALICFFASISPLQAQTNSWQQMDFAQQYHGSLRALHVSPDGAVLAGAFPIGLERSTDGGKSWSRVRLYSQDEPVWIASTSVNSIFCVGVTASLARSTDKGQTWTDVGPQWAYALAVSSTNEVFVSADLGVHRSTDDGRSWTLIKGYPPNSIPGQRIRYDQIVISQVGTRRTLFLVGRDPITLQFSLFRSTDNGDLWTLISTGVIATNVFVHTNGYLFSRSPQLELMRSTDNGDSWKVVSTKKFSPQAMFSLPNSDIWVGEMNDSLIGGTPLFRSTDNGETWNGFDTLGTGLINAFARGIDGSIFMGTDRTGIFKTTDVGLTWSQANTGIPYTLTQITSISGISGGFMSAGTSQFGSFISTNSGVNWTRNYPGHYDGIARIVAHPGGRIFACPDGNSRFKYLLYSADHGEHWETTGSLINGTDVAIGVNGDIFNIGSQDRLGSGVFLSTDLGDTWTSLHCPGESFERIHVTRQGTIVVLTPFITWDYIHPTEKHYITRTSTDGGASWITYSLANDRMQIYEYTSTRNNFLFAGTDAGVYRSTDSGLTWAPTGLASPAVRSFATNSSDVIFAGTWVNGVYISTDYGVSWDSLNAGLTDKQITALFCDADDYLIAGTYNQGIFKTARKTTAVDKQTDRPPIRFALLQNYPNPFNPSTTIRYGLPRQANASLKIFNTLGQLVATLVDERKEAGSYQSTWNADVPSGIYFCRLQAGEFLETRKMILLK
jgi:photosystem II stability/assembly factor-like uncharacterized protein